MKCYLLSHDCNGHIDPGTLSAVLLWMSLHECQCVYSLRCSQLEIPCFKCASASKDFAAAVTWKAHFSPLYASARVRAECRRLAQWTGQVSANRRITGSKLKTSKGIAAPTCKGVLRHITGGASLGSHNFGHHTNSSVTTFQSQHMNKKLYFDHPSRLICFEINCVFR